MPVSQCDVSAVVPLPCQCLATSCQSIGTTINFGPRDGAENRFSNRSASIVQREYKRTSNNKNNHNDNNNDDNDEDDDDDDDLILSPARPPCLPLVFFCLFSFCLFVIGGCTSCLLIEGTSERGAKIDR